MVKHKPECLWLKDQMNPCTCGEADKHNPEKLRARIVELEEQLDETRRLHPHKIALAEAAATERLRTRIAELEGEIRLCSGSCRLARTPTESSGGE
ncbi:MAG: hypothetical protein ACYTEQ_25960 [Planctomycetota bacterium]|jgi:hypothetical protein